MTIVDSARLLECYRGAMRRSEVYLMTSRLFYKPAIGVSGLNRWRGKIDERERNIDSIVAVFPLDLRHIHDPRSGSHGMI